MFWIDGSEEDCRIWRYSKQFAQRKSPVNEPAEKMLRRIWHKTPPVRASLDETREKDSETEFALSAQEKKLARFRPGRLIRIVSARGGNEKGYVRKRQPPKEYAALNRKLPFPPLAVSIVYEPIRNSGLLAKLVYCGRNRSVLYCSFTLTNFLDAVIVAIGTLS